MDPESRVWPDVLDVIYSNGGSITHWIEVQGEWEYHDSAVIYRIDAEEDRIQDAIDLLMSSELLKRVDQHGKGSHVRQLRLTKRGFEVAHERELMEKQQETMEQQRETNQNLAFFTLILAFAAIIQTIAAALQLDNPSNQLLLLLIILVLTIAIAFYQSNPREWLQHVARSLREKF
ncbi:hypothetical protein [Haloplanus rubicundus]|uniref:hypothetical protein n=1 Tax=Haloplanus rubicundus TaxID=1547898 RepID=UPI001300A04C|nr:hypothetical protein [Haloplanus rubicundus]